MNRLNLQNICYGNILENISLEFNSNTIHAILGPNGTGKSTLFKIIMGILKPSSGQVILNGAAICDQILEQRVKSGIAYLPQGNSIFTGLTVHENLLVASQTLHNDNNLLEKVISDFGLTGIINKKGKELSGGQTRRVEIARCMLLKPNFLLLDEPFAGIDPITIKEIEQILKAIKAIDTCVIITDHQAEKTIQMSDITTIMANGSALITGKSDLVGQDDRVKKIYLG